MIKKKQGMGSARAVRDHFLTVCPAKVFNLTAGITAAAVLSAAFSAPAFASSPEFARSAEEWAQLRDNKIEYGELEGLIEEYNATVQNNQYSYRKFRDDYGDTNDEVSNEYLKLAKLTIVAIILTIPVKA